MIGELAALTTALVWAVGMAMLKPLSTRFHPILLNQIRCSAAALFFALLLAMTGQFELLPRVPPQSAIIAILGTFVGVGIGESFFILSLRYIDVSRAYPIAASGAPLVTVAVAFFALNENISGTALVGILLVLLGLYLVANPKGPLLVNFSLTSPRERRGLLLLVLTIITWGLSFIWIKEGTIELDGRVANFIRFAGSSVLLIPFTVVHWVRLRKNIKWTNLSLAGANGALSFGIGGIFFLFALKESGAAMTSVLSSTSPLFLVPMAVLFLNERITSKMIAGVSLSVLGIFLVFLS